MARGNHEWTDGDSFRVRLRDGRLETFRLYFADTTKSRTRGKRSDEQAAYFARGKKSSNWQRIFILDRVSRSRFVHLNMQTLLRLWARISRKLTGKPQQLELNLWTRRSRR
jgi:hypothetical protein